MKSNQRSHVALGLLILALFFLQITIPSAQAQTATLSSASHNFGSVALTSSASTNVRLTNSGTTALSVSSITPSGGFTETNTCVTTPVAAGRSCVITITFAPTTIATFTGAVTIADGAGTQTIALQ